MKLDVSYEETLPHPIETVWAELTSAGAISDWLMATPDFAPVAGARFRMKTQHLSKTGWVEAEVLELEPPRRMVWAWSAGDGNPPSRVTFELRPHEGGTQLRLTHVGEMEEDVVKMLRDGWPGRIEALAGSVRRTRDGREG